MKYRKNITKIGVFGIHSAAGTTHITQMLALYLAGCRRKKVFVAEADSKASFRNLEKYMFGSVGEGGFSLRRCDYRYDGKADEKVERDYIIYDAGSGNECKYELLFSCDFCIAIGSGGIFYRKMWEDFLRGREVRERIGRRGMQDWRFIENHAATGSCRAVTLCVGERKYKLKMYGLGTEENLLHLSKKAQKLMKKMDI